MKIGILTQPLHANYGGLLQNYALQQTLFRAGHEVETIDWVGPQSLISKVLNIRMKILSLLMPQRYKAPKYQLTEQEKSIIQRNTNHFIQKYISHTDTVVSFMGFAKQARVGKYEGYVVGSDQCWRPIYNPFLLAMFLNFTDGRQVKRISYAASFGTDSWEFSQHLTLQCASLAQKFDLLTVREDSGVKLCKEFLGVDATHVLDPTMLLKKEDYVKLINTENEPQADGTLFNYILDPDDVKASFINKVAEDINLKIFQVLPKCQAETRSRNDVKNSIEDCVFPSVTTWLRAFMDAEMTIVDSFHGMVFSIIFNKPFWVIGNAKRGMSRFTSLLKLFNLEDRLLDVSELAYIDFKRPIEWGNVNNILEQERNKSKNLLLSALK